MNPPTLYQRLLGDEFSRLPSVLQRFHSLPGGGCAKGTIAVERGTGMLRRFAAQALQLPPAGPEVALRLQVMVQGEREKWIRHFDGQDLETWQWQEGPHLVEQAGPMHFVFRLAADEGGLVFHPLETRLRGVRVPRGLALRVQADARGREDSWRIVVRIGAPFLGTVTTYSGEIISS